jgi:hypothetical protein
MHLTCQLLVQNMHPKHPLSHRCLLQYLMPSGLLCILPCACVAGGTIDLTAVAVGALALMGAGAALTGAGAGGGLATAAGGGAAGAMGLGSGWLRGCGR